MVPVMADRAPVLRDQVAHLVDLVLVVHVRVDLVDRVLAVDPVVPVVPVDLVVQVAGQVVLAEVQADPEVDLVLVVAVALHVAAVVDDVVVRMISSPE